MPAGSADRVPLRARHWFIALAVVPLVMPVWEGCMVLFGSAAGADTSIFGFLLFAPLAYPPAAIFGGIVVGAVAAIAFRIVAPYAGLVWIWAASAAASAVAIFVAPIVVAHVWTAVGCPPDVYECPR